MYNLTPKEFEALPIQDRLVALQDPLNFLKYCTFTMDEVDRRLPIKPAPVDRPYILSLAAIWDSMAKGRIDGSVLIVDKSRRMWVSWLFKALHLHYAFTNISRRVGIVSKKAEDSFSHLRDMEFIWKNIPENIYPAKFRPQMRTKEGFIFFDEIDSTIHGIASGPDQTRQYGFSCLFFDEFDFWEQQEPTYGAAEPTLKGGGVLTIATTHAPTDSGKDSFYKAMVTDTLDGYYET